MARQGYVLGTEVGAGLLESITFEPRSFVRKHGGQRRRFRIGASGRVREKGQMRMRGWVQFDFQTAVSTSCTYALIYCNLRPILLRTNVESSYRGKIALPGCMMGKPKQEVGPRAYPRTQHCERGSELNSRCRATSGVTKYIDHTREVRTRSLLRS